MADLTDSQWLDILFFDFWLPPPLISMVEFERQLEAVREAMA